MFRILEIRCIRTVIVEDPEQGKLRKPFQDDMSARFNYEGKANLFIPLTRIFAPSL